MVVVLRLVFVKHRGVSTGRKGSGETSRKVRDESVVEEVLTEGVGGST